MRELPFLFDPGPIIAFQRLLGSGWEGPFELLSLLGFNWGILLALGVGLWLWGRRVAYGVIVVALVEAAVTTSLSHALGVPRPDAAGLVEYRRIGMPSFPSGHVTTASVVWSWIAVHGRAPWALPIGLVLAVSAGRIYLGVHYLGDVLGGILVGALVLWLVHASWGRVWPRLAGRSFGFFVGLAVICLAGVVASAFLYFADDPYRWRGGGLVAGLALALPVEHRLVRYRPGGASPLQKAAMIMLGAAGIGACAAADVAIGEDSLVPGLLLTALAAVWAALAAPALFRRLGWSAASSEER